MTIGLFLQFLFILCGVGMICGLFLSDVDRLSKAIAITFTFLIMGCAAVLAGAIV